MSVELLTPDSQEQLASPYLARIGGNIYDGLYRVASAQGAVRKFYNRL